MSLVYFQGDIFDTDERVIVHGCNCFKAMGSGMARQVREHCRSAWQADQATLYGDKNKLGTFTYAVETNPRGNKFTLVNAYTQYKYSRTERDVDYDALEKVMIGICEHFGDKIIAMPKIGCGLAGGDWEFVSNILGCVSDRFDREFHVYEWKAAAKVLGTRFRLL